MNTLVNNLLHIKYCNYYIKKELSEGRWRLWQGDGRGAHLCGTILQSCGGRATGLHLIKVIEYHRAGLENVALLKFRDGEDALVHEAAGQRGVVKAPIMVIVGLNRNP
jgi:hypothetical protein